MPRITINEIDKTKRLVASYSNAGTRALIGPAIKGQKNTPTEFTNVSDFQDMFGDDIPQYNPYAYLAAIDSLKKGATVLFTRINDGNIAAATINICADKILVTASSEGTWGNKLSVTLRAVNGVAGTYVVDVLYNNKVISTSSFTLTELLAGPINCKHVTLSVISGVQENPLTSASTLANVDTPAVLTGGADGDAFFETIDRSTNSAGMTTVMTSYIIELEKILSILTDKTWYDFTVLAIPGMTSYNGVNATTPTTGITQGSNVVEQLQSFATRRDDCFIILDPDKTDTPTSVLTGLSLTNPTQTSIAVFYPWYYSVINKSGTIMLLPPSLFYLNASAIAHQVTKPWMAVAGPNTGISDNILSAATLIGSETAEELNNSLINPIAYHRNFGYFIDGNNVLNTGAKSRIYSQLSVRNAIIYTKKAITRVCEQLSYRNNSSITRAEVLGRISAVLIELQAGEAIFGYRAFINDSEYDEAEGKIHITCIVYPTPALEEFVIDFEIVNSKDAL